MSALNPATLGGIALGLAGFQAFMVQRNLRLFLPPRANPEAKVPPIVVLVPARNEAQNLPALLDSLVRQTDCEFRVVILDDNSEDGTLKVAQNWCARDPRLQAISSPPLPDGWAGKQHACHQLSLHTSDFEHWLFLDADVRLTDSHALARISAHLDGHPAAMLSGIPHQQTQTWAERLIVPLIHLVLLGFLPFWEMRRNRLPALGAACGQMVAVRASAYNSVGGHAAIRHRLHDATALAGLLREGGFLTDLFDATPLADCRMYDNAKDVFEGFGKNATEGMAQPHLLPVWTCLLLGANVLPWFTAIVAPTWSATTLVAMALNLGVYLALMTRYRQSGLGALTRPIGVAVFIAIQWRALVGKWLGQTATWKGRIYKPIHK